MNRRALLGGALAAPALLSVPVRAQGVITLNGASQFGDDHPYTKAMVKFEELVKQYYGKPINFVLHKNSSLGLEKQYFEYMAQGRAVDYAMVSPAHMSTFSKAAPFVDAPFIFRDLAHWNQVLDAGPVQAGGGRGREARPRAADRLWRRRHPQHLRQQEADQPGRHARA